MDLNNAVAKHAEWKTKFRMAIAKKESMDASTIAKDNCCELGKWLHGEGKNKFGHLSVHGDCVTKHANFHTEAGKVANAINSKKYDEAESMLNTGTNYAAASSAVGVSLMKLQKEIGA